MKYKIHKSNYSSARTFYQILVSPECFIFPKLLYWQSLISPIVLLMISCLSAVTKYVTITNLRKEGLIWTYDLKEDSPSRTGRHGSRNRRDLVHVGLAVHEGVTVERGPQQQWKLWGGEICCKNILQTCDWLWESGLYRCVVERGGTWDRTAVIGVRDRCESTRVHVAE